MKTSSYPDDVLPEYCERVYDLVMKNKPADATYLLTSFDYRVLRYMQTHHPDADLMLITGKPCHDETISLCKTIGGEASCRRCKRYEPRERAEGS